MTNSHQERVRVIGQIVGVCHEKSWNYDTPGLADKISLIAARWSYSKPARKDLVYCVIERLQLEKEAVEVAKRLKVEKAEADAEDALRILHAPPVVEGAEF